MRSLIKSVTNGKRVLILGYGREGRSSLRFIRESCPGLPLVVADANPDLLSLNPELHQEGISVFTGPDYLQEIDRADLVIKSPGISLQKQGVRADPSRISSQTDLFLRAYGAQVAGITGTKGKSTTASLLYHIMHTYSPNVLFAGNIGIPLFNLIPDINTETRIVCELSSHQLEYISRGPHIAVLLNLFQEHLDHYPSFYDYQMAKLQAGLKQSESDYFIYTAADENTRLLMKQHSLRSRLVPVYPAEFTGNGVGISGPDVVLRIGSAERALIPADYKTRLTGIHNQINIRVAAAAAALMQIPAGVTEQAVASFSPLEHRIEFVGTFNGKRFYNDSISTIPEATIAAVNTIGQVHTLILGGFDRGIDYTILMEFISTLKETKLIFTGPAGKRMLKEFSQKGATANQASFFHDFTEAVTAAIDLTPEGGNCLLSPAAASYDSFTNFEERGKYFRELVSGKK